MGLFSRKTKADAAAFAQQFYERSLFGPFAVGFDTWHVLVKSIYTEVSAAEPSFAAVHLPTLTQELTGLRLEMIGLAWTHATWSRWGVATPETALAVTAFTKTYLSDMGRPDLWEIMTFYNAAVADAYLLTLDRKSAADKHHVAMVNQRRLTFAEMYYPQGWDLEAIGRVANRIGSETNWKAGATPRLCAVRMTPRLRIEESESILTRLAAYGFGFYEGAKETLAGTELTA